VQWLGSKLARPDAKNLGTATKERKAEYELTSDQLKRAKDSLAFPIRMLKRPRRRSMSKKGSHQMAGYKITFAVVAPP
jgi:hypothetical protein